MNKFNFLVFIDDDHPTNYYHEIIASEAEIAQKMLFFQSGEKALEELEAWQKSEAPQPDIIFLDINMPRMNGWEFLDKYQEMITERSTKIIVLTTSVNPADKEKAERHPWVSRFMSKPLTIEAFNELRVNWLGEY